MPMMKPKGKGMKALKRAYESHCTVALAAKRQASMAAKLQIELAAKQTELNHLRNELESSTSEVKRKERVIQHLRAQAVEDREKYHRLSNQLDFQERDHANMRRDIIAFLTTILK